MESSNVQPAVANGDREPVPNTNGKDPGQGDGRPPGRRNLLLEAMNSVENQERLKKREVLLERAKFHKEACRQKLLLEGNLPSPDGSFSSTDLVASSEPEPETSAAEMTNLTNDLYSWMGEGDCSNSRSNSSCEGTTAAPNLSGSRLGWKIYLCFVCHWPTLNLRNPNESTCPVGFVAMYIDHYRKDFYNHLLGHRVLLMATPEVDSVCTVKIMQYLFRLDDNPYILEIISGIDEMKQKFKDYNMIRRVVLINCGGTVDLMELFENPTDVIIFVIDSHRPTHVLNIYNESKQIRIVTSPEDEERIPSFDEIFRSDAVDEVDSDDSSDEDQDVYNPDGDESGPSPGEKRKRGAEKRAEMLIKQKERRDWDHQRAILLFNYTKHNYFGSPASLVGLEVAWSKSIADSEIIWWAIVGLTEYLLLHRMDRTNYTLLVSTIQNHVARVTHEMNPSLSVLKITFEHELYLYLYRHWNLYASMRHTPAWRSKFRLWSSKGTQRLHSYLAEIGFPLKEVKQSFDSMNLHYRRELKTILNRRAEKYDLVDDMSFGSFVAQYGYGYKLSAMDHYLSAFALLEEPGEKSLSTRFHASLLSLCKTQKPKVMEGIGIAKQIITGMISQVQIFLDLKQIVVTNDLLYAVIQYGTLEAKYFRHPLALVLLAHQTLQAFISSSPRGKMMHQLPLVMMAPKSQNRHYVVGIPPLATDINQNLFGKAFQQIAKKMPNTLSMNLFETSTCILKSSEIEKFLEHLLELLA